MLSSRITESNRQVLSDNPTEIVVDWHNPHRIAKLYSVLNSVLQTSTTPQDYEQTNFALFDPPTKPNGTRLVVTQVGLFWSELDVWEEVP